jgi:hypothetical protein
VRHRARAAAGAARAKHTDAADTSLAGVPPRREITAARTHQSTVAKSPFDLDRIATYHDHGCLHRTKERPSLPAKERGGPLRFQNVISLSSHTNKRPPAGSPCDHHRRERRYPAPPSSCRTSFNTGNAT